MTVKTQDNFPYFREPIFCDFWIEELKLCKQLKKFELYGFCLLYDHFHIILKPEDEYNISKVMQFLKRHFSRNTNIILGCTNPKVRSSDEGDNGHCRLQVEEAQTLIQQLDENVTQWKSEFNQKYTPQKQLLFNSD